MANAFIASGIDYGNSLLIGMPDRCDNHLQHIQNCTARLIANTQKYSHIQPVRKRLHWLPVKRCIIFKMHGLAPLYIYIYELV